MAKECDQPRNMDLMKCNNCEQSKQKVLSGDVNY